MYLKFLTVLFVSIFALSTSISVKAQETDSSWSYNWSDSTSHEWDDFDIDFHFDFLEMGKPSINVVYGIPKNSLHNTISPFSKSGLAEIKLGYTKERDVKKTDYLFKHKFSYLAISNISYSLSKGKTAGEINTNTWRISFGWEDGYGYKFGNSSLILYNTWGMGWSRVHVEDTLTNLFEKEELELFNDSFRFGTMAAGGIKFRVIPSIELDAGYERAAIFPRHIFWKWAGSALIEGAGQGLIDAFVKKILASSPSAAPVVSFILKNGLSYAAYELRKDKMNYPFDSAPPIITDSFKFGVTFIF